MTDFCLMFGWICFILVWLDNICYYKRNNYWMPTIWIFGGIVFCLVTYCFAVALW